MQDRFFLKYKRNIGIIRTGISNDKYFYRPLSAMISKLLKCLSLFIMGLILNQCGDMSSEDYVAEGLGYTKQERYSDAKESFKKAVEKDPENLDAYYGLGGIYNFEKKYDAAEKAFKSALQIDPTHINSWYSLGYTYELMDKKEDSEKSFEKYRRLKGQMDSITNKEKP